MPKCKLCGEKKEFYSELGYCDACTQELRAFLQMSKKRLAQWQEESLEADEERRREIGEQARALEEALHRYEKHGVVFNRSEYRSRLRAIYAHCGIPTKTGAKKPLPILIGGGVLCAALAAAAVVFGVLWQGAQGQCAELQTQNEQMTMALSDLQMQLDAALAGQSGMDGGAVDGGFTDGGFSDSGSADGGFVDGNAGGIAADGGGVMTDDGGVAVDGGAVAVPMPVG